MKLDYTIQLSGPVPEELRQRLETGEIDVGDFFSALRDLGIGYYPVSRELVAELDDRVTIIGLSLKPLDV